MDIPRRYCSSYGIVTGRRALPAPLAGFDPVSPEGSRPGFRSLPADHQRKDRPAAGSCHQP
ncbi:MAG: hypothetical protein ACK53Y_01080, partial [bacterium]